MTDDPTKPSAQGPGDGQPKKRRRRRRRNKNKANQAPDPSKTNPPQANDLNTQASKSNTSAQSQTSQKSQQQTTPDRPANAASGYRGRDDNPSKSRSNDRPSRKNNQTDRPANAAKQTNATAKPQKKRRKPRTKQCVHCFTPCTTIHRVRIDYRKQWVFICDICWPTRCIDNPHYEFGGTWVSGRIVKPESQQRDERLAKQAQKNKPTPASNS